MHKYVHITYIMMMMMMTTLYLDALYLSYIFLIYHILVDSPVVPMRYNSRCLQSMALPLRVSMALANLALVQKVYVIGTKFCMYMYVLLVYAYVLLQAKLTFSCIHKQHIHHFLLVRGEKACFIVFQRVDSIL